MIIDNRRTSQVINICVKNTIEKCANPFFWSKGRKFTDDLTDVKMCVTMMYM